MAKSNFIVRGGADFSSIRQEFQNTQKQLVNFQEQTNKTMSMVGRALKAGLGYVSLRAIKSIVKETTKWGSDVAEIQNVVDVTFGTMTKDIESFAKSSMDNFGLSELAAKKYSSYMGAMLKSSGITGGAVKDMSIDLSKLTADMASFFNMENEEMFKKIMSGMSGMTMPLKQLGINMNIANLEAFALSQGIKKSYQEMSQAEQAMLRYNYLMSVTGDMQGDFSRNAHNWGHQLKILSEEWNRLKATMGQGFINILMPIIRMFNALIKHIQVAAEYFRAFTALIFGDTQAGRPAATDLGYTIDALGDIQDGYSNAGKAAKKAGKDIKNALTGFDEINVLSLAKDNGASDSSGGVSSPSSAVVDFGNLASGEGGIIEISEKLTKVVGNLKEKLKPATDALSRLWDAIKPLGKELGKGFIDFVKKTTIEIAKPLAEKVPGWIDKLATALNKIDPDNMRSLGESLGILFTAFGGSKLIIGVLKAFSKLGGLIEISKITGLAEINPVAFVALFDPLLQSLEDIALDLMPDWAKKIWEILGDSLAGIVTGGVIGSWFPGIGTVAGVIVGGIGGAIIGAFKKYDLGKVLKEKVFAPVFNFDMAKTFFGEAIEHFKKAFKGDDWKEIGINIIMGILKGFSGAILFIIEPIGDFFKEFDKGLRELFGIKSPATKMEPIGRNILLGVVEGFKNGFKFMWEKISEFGQNTKLKLEKEWDDATSKIKDLRVNFSAFVTTTVNGIKEKWNNLSSQWKDKVNNFKINVSTLRSTIESKWNNLSASFKDKIVDFKVKLSTTVGSIKNFVNNIVSQVNSKLIAKLDFTIRVPSWLGGGTWGWKAPRIPYMAKGGIVDQPTLAMIGEAGKEAVVPLENNTGWIKNLAGQIRGQIGSNGDNYNSSEMISILYKILDAILSGRGDTILKIGESEIGRATLKAINKLSRQEGKSRFEYL